MRMSVAALAMLMEGPAKRPSLPDRHGRPLALAAIGRLGPRLGKLARPREHRVEHGFGQLSGEGVLLARVEGAEQPASVAQLVFRAVPETRLGPQRQQLAGRVPAELAEADDHPDPVEQLQLLRRVRQAVVALLRQRLVRRRRAADGRADERAVQAQPVAECARDGLVREAGPGQRGEEPVARAVAGEDAPGAVAAVGRGRQPEDVHARGRVAEAGHRTAPVLLAGEGGALLARDLLAPGDEPRAAAAARDALLQAGERRAGLEAGARGYAFSLRPLVNSHCDQR